MSTTSNDETSDSPPRWSPHRDWQAVRRWQVAAIRQASAMEIALPALARLAQHDATAARVAELFAAGVMQSSVASEMMKALLALRPPSGPALAFTVEEAVENLHILWDLAAPLAAELDHTGADTAAWLADYVPGRPALGRAFTEVRAALQALTDAMATTAPEVAPMSPEEFTARTGT